MSAHTEPQPGGTEICRHELMKIEGSPRLRGVSMALLCRLTRAEDQIHWAAINSGLTPSASLDDGWLRSVRRWAPAAVADEARRYADPGERMH